MNRKKGGILVGNIVFIILNLLYLTILVIFLLRFSSGTTLLEESYSKQITLVLDSAKPNMVIFLNMEDAIETAKENKWGSEHLNEIVKIRDNLVTVKLSENSGYSYSFFNSIDIAGYYITDEPSQGYIFNIGGYK